MEYTISIGEVFETYKGSPEEIAKLLELQDLTEEELFIVYGEMDNQDFNR